MKRLFDHNAALFALLLALLAAMATIATSETPRGRVLGTLVAAESGSPLGKARVTLSPRGANAPRYRTVTDSEGAFTFPNVAVGRYRLTAETEAHQQNPQVIEVVEGADTAAIWELQPVEPFLQVFQHQRVFTPSEPAKLEVHGFAPVTELSVKTYRIARSAELRTRSDGVGRALGVRGGLASADLSQAPSLTLANASALPILRRDAEGTFRKDVVIGKLPPGMYLISFEAGPTRAVSVITVTDIGIILKSSPVDNLVFAANIVTGEPVANARVEVMAKDKTLAAGNTGLDGTLALKPVTGHEGQMVVVARFGDSIAIAESYAERTRPGANLRVFSYTDRPVYRPGHTVQYKVIARRLVGEKYTVPSGLKAHVRVVDRNEDVVYAGDATTNSHGSLNGGFPLNRAALPGQYSISVNIAGSSYETSFMVAEYRKPEFQVSVKPDRKRYTGAETVHATIDAQYFYGAGVPDAKVTWLVTSNPAYYGDDEGQWDEDLSLEPESDSYDGGVVAYGEGATDAMGRLRVEFAPTPAPAGDDFGQDRNYTVTATVVDASKYSAEGSGSTLVTQGDFRLEVRADAFLGKPGVPVGVQIRAVDYDGQAVPNLSGRLEFSRRHWKDGEVTKTAVGAQAFRTDSKGQATVTVTPPADGDYALVARATDARRNEITQGSDIFVMSGDNADYGYAYSGVQVHAAKRVFKEGEQAEIVVQSPYAGQTALLTLEGSRVVWKQVVRLAGKSNIVRVPITRSCMPAVNATVSFFHKKNFYSGSAVINVSREHKALKVEVTSDKAIYQPGESAVYHVVTRSPDGKPVSAEVSLGLVDEAVYSILEDQTPNIVSFFYPKRLYEVRTEFSFPAMYLSGDEKAGSGVRTRRLFPDTAFWRPATVTDANGDAAFRVTMPDNLTTWRATCRAADMDTRVGQAAQSVIVQKPFLLRLETPRFMIQGDEVEIAAIAHNLTGADVNAGIGLDCALAPLSGTAQVQRTVRAGHTEQIAWRIRPTDIGNLRIRVWGTAGPLNDAMELSTPVLARGREETDTRSGDVLGVRTERMQVRTDCVPGTQHLTVRLSPSLLSAMLGSLDYLAQYPYGCAEQTMSAFLPDVMLHQMLRNQGVNMPELRARVPEMVQEGLLKLHAFQHDDGGWRWWTYDPSDPWMTAYVSFGLIQARDAGFAVNPTMLSNGLNALNRMATNGERKMGSDTRSYAAYVLSLAGAGEAAAKAAGIAETTAGVKGMKLSDWGRPWLALALARTGQPERGRSVLASAWTGFSDRGFQPKANPNEWRSGAEYGAALVYAACELTPNDPRLPSLVRWIMDQRRANHWDSTRDTAAVLYALTRYVALTHELNANLNAAVLVNGRRIVSRRLTAADMFRPEFSITLNPKDLPIGPTNVIVRATGTGRLYYTATLTQTATEGMNAPLLTGAGITVERFYRKVEVGENPIEARALARSRETVTEFRSGDIVEVTLVVRASLAYDYLMIEDPLPAGAEVRDRGAVDPSEWTFWWADQIVRDQKISFAVRHINPGSKHIQYRFTATVPGRYTALPPRVFDMYNPAIRGEGRADEVRIR